jgi:uncharacterized protein (TIGR02594 family)
MGLTTLRYGSRGRDVQRLQELLNKRLRPAPPLRVDGYYGPLTEVAVRSYQVAAGLHVDGIAGECTWAALNHGILEGQHSRFAGFIPEDFPCAPWMAIAMREIGESEVKGPEDNPRILQYRATTTLRSYSDEAAWCSSFVNWCLLQVGITGTNSAAAISWINWGKPCVPMTGAVTIIRNAKVAGSRLTASGYHVGFLVQDLSSHYRLLGGNQSDQVKKTLFPKCAWRLIGHRWPDFKWRIK